MFVYRISGDFTIATGLTFNIGNRFGGGGGNSKGSQETVATNNEHPGQPAAWR